MAVLIEVSEIADGWESLVKKIMSEGEEIHDERGSLTKELLNAMVSIKNPLGNNLIESNYFGLNTNNKTNNIENIRVPKGYFWSGDKLKTYSEQLIDKDKQGFVYTYGNRLRKHFNNIDQLQEAISRLKSCNESRRAISITWDPNLDTVNDEVPCMILVDLKIRNNELYTTALWRSHDIYGAWFPNVVGLTYLSQYAADQLSIDIGSITVHSISAHIYEVNFDEANNY